jgi:hypothetical protein
MDVSDVGVRGVPASRPSVPVAATLEAIRRQAALRQVRWYWVERHETDGQRRCQALINRQVRALPRITASSRRAGLPACGGCTCRASSAGWLPASHWSTTRTGTGRDSSAGLA